MDEEFFSISMFYLVALGLWRFNGGMFTFGVTLKQKYSPELPLPVLEVGLIVY